MSPRVQQYINAAKNKPSILFHLGLFAVMTILNVAVWNSLERIFPGQGAEFGQTTIIASSICILMVIVAIVVASGKTIKRALVLIVLATLLEIGEYGCHWLYARELSAAEAARAVSNAQKTVNDGLATNNATRTIQVLDKLTEFNRSQAKLSESDSNYYKQTGVRINRKTQNAPSLESLGIVVNNEESKTDQGVKQPPVMTNSLNVTVIATPTPTPKPSETVSIAAAQTEEYIRFKWVERFAIAGILRLLVVFGGTALLLASWEWDWNGNGLNDAKEGAEGKA